ncbi:MAG: hypothetical protein NTZ87_00210 [Candidatus Nomurabacteria bacterium]|nr:hypothetical protein [Candidatus Nomurabacteria bacterium]
MRKIFLSGLLFAVILGSGYFFAQNFFSPKVAEAESGLVKYNGKIQHIFVHSLIIYPEKAQSDTDNATGYRDNMITVKQFETIIQELYDNNFILINSQSLYSFNANGKIKQNTLYLPKGKRPLILSLDDLSYYPYMKNGGFANKLVLDNGIVKTEVITPEGKKTITNDGDAVPIVDEFVKEHPDFSQDGAKGIIALTGFQGILGYRTQLKNAQGDVERASVLPVVDALKKTGWIFASHSFTHNQVFLRETISTAELAKDISKWKAQVESLVGPTNIFVGPFGEVFKEGDSRRQQLIDAGFNVFYGVGLDGYFKFFSDHFVMNRIDIDGYRLTHNPKTLFRMFGISMK